MTGLGFLSSSVAILQLSQLSLKKVQFSARFPLSLIGGGVGNWLYIIICLGGTLGCARGASGRFSCTGGSF